MPFPFLVLISSEEGEGPGFLKGGIHAKRKQTADQWWFSHCRIKLSSTSISCKWKNDNKSLEVSHRTFWIHEKTNSTKEY